ncbi:MAG: hypothetical protein ACE5FJ_01435, partial [Gemmatimonadales bacterium]
MPQLIEVRFKGNRKNYFTWNQEPPLGVGSSVVVAVDRGQDLGVVTATGDVAEKKCGLGCSGCARGQKQSTGKVLREASKHETHVTHELRKAEEDVRRKVMEDLCLRLMDPDPTARPTAAEARDAVVSGAGRTARRTATQLPR